MKSKLINRREFLKLSALTAVGATAAACGAQATPTKAPAPTAAPAAKAQSPPRRPEPTKAPAAAARRARCDQGP